MGQVANLRPVVNRPRWAAVGYLVHEILNRLSANQRVLDLGCAAGSFRYADSPATAIRADLDPQPGQSAFVRCDARSLPFADASFDAVILNHSFEHFDHPQNVLSEIARILRNPGYLYLAVPDASTMTDRVYRWIARGGGHVNQFTDKDSLERFIEKYTGLPHVATRVLFSSYLFLNRRNGSLGFGRRMYFVGRGAESVLRLGTFVLRRLDSRFATRTSIYGWAFYFGPSVDVDIRPWSNVYVRCGAGRPSAWLLASGRVRRGRLGLRLFPCPDLRRRKLLHGRLDLPAGTLNPVKRRTSQTQADPQRPFRFPPAGPRAAPARSAP